MHAFYTALLVVCLAAFVLRWARLSCLAGVSIHGDVLLVFAHPDDEAMFFTPLLHSLRRRNVSVHFLCLSTGNFDGLGKTREKELYASGAFFGVPRRNIKVVDHAELQDGVRNVWSATLVRKEIEAYMQKAGSISTVVTFDSSGVSGHPNHIAVYRGVRELRDSMPPGLLYLQLKTRNILMKYVGPLAALSYTTWASTTVSRTNFVALVHPLSAWASAAAMQRHASQLVWFRYLFVAFSSYTYVNELQEL